MTSTMSAETLRMMIKVSRNIDGADKYVSNYRDDCKMPDDVLSTVTRYDIIRNKYGHVKEVFGIGGIYIRLASGDDINEDFETSDANIEKHYNQLLSTLIFAPWKEEKIIA